jgi:hypothetical protein
VSDTKLKPLKVSDLRLLARRRPRERVATPLFVPWMTVRPLAGESARWECFDGRWITISLGHGDHMGQALVQSSTGQSEYVDSFEAALALAKEWRTEPSTD